jgi:PEP-CTERM motif
MRGLRFAIISLLVLAAVCLCPASAAAHSIVRMKLVGVGGNNADGVYTYPYYFSINGKAPVSLICDTYDNQVTMGEIWKAHESSLVSGKGLFGSQLMDYKAAGLIFKSILNGTVSVNAGNFAIWGLFSTNAKNSAFFQGNGTAALDASFLALAAKAPNSAFQGLVLYTPIAGTQSWGGTPQEYIGYSAVPEPATLTLFGTGLLSLAGMLRRKTKKV